jgi:hypothetical protein
MIPKRRRNGSEVARNRNLRDEENRIRECDGEKEGFHTDVILRARRACRRAPGHGIAKLRWKESAAFASGFRREPSREPVKPTSTLTATASLRMIAWRLAAPNSSLRTTAEVS